jgi:hypothetical protein
MNNNVKVHFEKGQHLGLEGPLVCGINSSRHDLLLKIKKTQSMLHHTTLEFFSRVRIEGSRNNSSEPLVDVISAVLSLCCQLPSTAY